MSQVGKAKGVFLMTSSNLAFCGMSLLIKLVSHIDSFKTTFARFTVGLAVLGTAALFRKIELKFVHRLLLFFRGLIGGTAVFIFYLSIAKIGIGKGTVINYSYPIFASLFGAMFLHEKVGLTKLLAIAAAFAGIYVLTIGTTGPSSQFGSIGKYEAIAIFGAVLWGISTCLIKQLHNTDSTYAIFFAQCVIGLWLMIVPANLFPSTVDLGDGLILIGIGLFAVVAQLLMTEGYRHLTVTTGSLLGMLLPVLNSGIGILVFRETFSLGDLLGSALVIGACVVVVWAEEDHSGLAGDSTGEHV